MSCATIGVPKKSIVRPGLKPTIPAYENICVEDTERKEHAIAMTEQEANIAGLRREWLAARIFVVLGGLLLVAIVVLAVISAPSVPVQTPRENTAIAPAMAKALCTAGLASAQAFALVPAYTKLAGDFVQVGAVKGRYVCFAQTDAARYQI